MRTVILRVVERHAEKGVFGLSAIFLCTMLWTNIVHSPNRVEFEGRSLDPGELNHAIGESANFLRERLVRAEAPPVDTPRYADWVARARRGGIFNPLRFASDGEPQPKPATVRDDLRVATSGGPPIVIPAAEERGPSKLLALVNPLPPKQLRVMTGRGIYIRRLLELSAESAPFAAPKSQADEVEMSFVTVFGYLDKPGQERETSNAGYAPERRRAYFTGVEAERRELLSSGEYSDWTLVDSDAMPRFEIPDFEIKPDGSMGRRREVSNIWDIVKRCQAQILQPPFFECKLGEAWRIPEETGRSTVQPRAQTGHVDRPLRADHRRAAPNPPNDLVVAPPRADWQPVAADIRAASNAMKAKDYAAAIDAAQRVLNNRAASAEDRRDAQRIHREAWAQIERARATDRAPAAHNAALVTHPDLSWPAVWLHDDTVQPGKTYQYRMRVKMWNRYLGQVRAVENPEDARKAVLEGEWSDPTDPITVAPATRFFVKGMKPDSSAALVEVWKWRKGKWVRQNFEVNVGDLIGGQRLIEPNASDVAVASDPKKDGQHRKVAVDFSTDAVVLDLRVAKDFIMRRAKAGNNGFDWYTVRDTLILTYLDPADGQVKERVQALDATDPIRKSLQSEDKGNG